MIEKIQIRSLRVLNCGPLRDDLILFGQPGQPIRPVTILGGANGSGKTTILELIASFWEMLQPMSNIPPPAFPRAEYAQLDLEVDGEPFSLFCGSPPEDAQVAEQSLGRPPSGQPPREIQGGLALEIIESIRLQEQRVLPFPGYLEGWVPETGVWLPSLLYFPHSRALLPITGSQISREDTQYRWIYRYETVQSFPGSLDSYLLWLDYAEPEAYNRVRSFLNGLNLGGKIFGIDRKSLQAIVLTPDRQTHPLQSLSSGEQNILVMLLELVRRLVPHSIVLIDELENSLHPAFQHLIGERLLWLQQKVPFQLILTTHSPAFLEIFGAESTLILTQF